MPDSRAIILRLEPKGGTRMRAVPNDKPVHRTPIEPGRALVPFVGRPQVLVRPSLQALLLAGVFGATLGIGGAGVYTLRHRLPWSGAAEVPAAQSTAMLHKLQDDLGRLQANVVAMKSAAESSRADDTLRGLKRTVDAMRQDVDQVRTTGSASLAQLAAKIDKIDRDPTPRLAEIASRLDRMEKSGKAADAKSAEARIADGKTADAKVADAKASDAKAVDPKLADAKPADPKVSEPKLVEPKPATAKPADVKAVAATPARPIDPSGHVDRVATGSIPVPSRPALVQQLGGAKTVPSKGGVTQVPASIPRPATMAPPSIDGWVLRDVYDGMALVQARNGGLREVEPGAMLPGAGEVQAIQRRGRGWVVLTSRGVIDTTAF